MTDLQVPRSSNRPRPGASAAGRGRPSPRPARLMVGAGALAALTVIGAGLVRFPAAADEATAPAPQPARVGAKAKLERPVRYVRLKPGQKAPKGATVIREAAPTPRIVVQRVAPQPVQQRSVRVVSRTRQSGAVR